MPTDLQILIPTADRPAELAVTLAGLVTQDVPFEVVVSDQSLRGGAQRSAPVRAMLRLLEAHGRPVAVLPHLPRRGLAEQRAFLLGSATADRVLFLDDDVWLEPGAVAALLDAIGRLGCGFVGMAPQGLSFVDDVRPSEHRAFEPWAGAVRPETVRPGSPAFERWRLHNAANLVHIAASLPLRGDVWTAYRVAWIGACVLYDRAALVASGGFDFWRDLPDGATGEDVVAQWRVMERFGGAGLLPSLAVHLETPTTIPERPHDAVGAVFGPG